MPDLPIDQLPSASALQPNNVFPVVQDNVTKQATYSSILYAPGNNYGLFTQTVSSTPITNTTTETKFNFNRSRYSFSSCKWIFNWRFILCYINRSYFCSK